VYELQGCFKEHRPPSPSQNTLKIRLTVPSITDIFSNALHIKIKLKVMWLFTI